MSDRDAMPNDPVRLPRLGPDRIAEAVEILAATLDDADTRAQLHALAGIVRNLVVGVPEPELDAAYRALADVPADDVGAPLARVAELEARSLRHVDWDAASHG